jgi:hypothetical protein
MIRGHGHDFMVSGRYNIGVDPGEVVTFIADGINRNEVVANIKGQDPSNLNGDSLDVSTHQNSTRGMW